MDNRGIKSEILCSTLYDEVEETLIAKIMGNPVSFQNFFPATILKKVIQRILMSSPRNGAPNSFMLEGKGSVWAIPHRESSWGTFLL